jgi:ABC-2 type transport system permease protein
MINKFLIGLVLMPSSIYTKMGVNVNHLKAILQVKLMMDDRRPNAFKQTKQDSKKKAVNSATIGSMVAMSVLGLMFIVPFFITSNTTTQFTLYFSMFIFFLAATLISDFTSVLIDVRDNQIILPKPISDKTFLMSRLLHIIIHISKLVIPLNLAGIITIGITKGIGAALIFVGVLPFAIVFTIFLINALYLVILKVTTPEKFKSAITYFQIIFAILIYGSYQIIPRMIDETTLENFAIPENGLMIIAPPYWFAAA